MLLISYIVYVIVVIHKHFNTALHPEIKLDVEPRRDDDASQMSS